VPCSPKSGPPDMLESLKSEKEDSKVLSTILCEIVFCQFIEEWQISRHFSYGL